MTTGGVGGGGGEDEEDREWEGWVEEVVLVFVSLLISILGLIYLEMCKMSVYG